MLLTCNYCKKFAAMDVISFKSLTFAVQGSFPARWRLMCGLSERIPVLSLIRKANKQTLHSRFIPSAKGFPFQETLGAFRGMTRNSSLRFSGICKTFTPFACRRSKYLRGTFIGRNINFFCRGPVLLIIYSSTTDKWWLWLNSKWLKCCNITLHDRCKRWFNITKDAYDYIGTH